MHKRLVPLLLLLLILLVIPVAAAPQLHLEASTTRSEFVQGDRFTIDAKLFNDGDQATSGSIQVTAPEGFAALSPSAVSGEIPAGRALELNSSYQVAAQVGLHTFQVSGGGQRVAVVIRVGPVVAPPALFPGTRIYLPAFY